MTKHAAQTEPSDTVTPVRPIPAFDSAMLANFTRAGEACTKSCLAWQEELFRFMSSRLQWDSKVGQALASCKNLSEVAEVQRDWLQSTAQDYFDEANRLAQLAAKLAPQWMMPFAVGMTEKKGEPPHRGL